MRKAPNAGITAVQRWKAKPQLRKLSCLQMPCLSQSRASLEDSANGVHRKRGAIASSGEAHQGKLSGARLRCSVRAAKLNGFAGERAKYFRRPFRLDPPPPPRIRYLGAAPLQIRNNRSAIRAIIGPPCADCNRLKTNSIWYKVKLARNKSIQYCH